MKYPGVDFFAEGLQIDNITDSMASTTWPALVMRGATGQQMPWLRPAAFGFRASAKFLLAETLRDVGGSFRGGA